MSPRSALRRAVSVLLLIPAALWSSHAHARADAATSANPEAPGKSSAKAADKAVSEAAARPAGKSASGASSKPTLKASTETSANRAGTASAGASVEPQVKASTRKPAPGQASAKAADRARVTPVAKVPGRGTGRAPKPAAACTYTVKRGDSLGRIAARHGVSQAALSSANRLPRSGAVASGRPLTIPGCDSDRPAPEVTAALREMPTDGIMHTRVGPRRVPTALHLALPDLSNTMTTLLWPIAGPIASPFGLRRSGWHAGVDIKADVGTPILAAAAGTVLVSGWERAYGRVVKIEHDDGFVTIYAHNLQNLVSVGDRVEAGALIATVGRTGRSSAYHLHFEVRRDGMAYNPLHVLPEPRDVFIARTDDPDTEMEEAEDEPGR